MINRNMPLEGDTNFEGFAYANGIELRGKPWYSELAYWSSYR
jgi:hypothetical protein